MTEVNLDTTYVVIPAKNEKTLIGQVLDSLSELGFSNIIVVNDGSDDGTCKVANAYKNVTVLTHVINLGAGASTMTGIKYAVKQNAEIILTIDADNQHNPEDLIPLIEEIHKSQAQLVIGSRFKKKNDIPYHRYFYNKIGNIASYLYTGMFLTDSQSGMKAMSHDFAKDLQIDFNGFEFCIEIIKNAKELNAKVVEYPIDVSYTAETLKKGQNLGNGFTMLMKLFSPFSY